VKVDALTTGDQSANFQRSGKGQDVPDWSHEIDSVTPQSLATRRSESKNSNTHEFDGELKRITGSSSRNRLRPDDFQISTTEVVFV